jgi:hypothetical protein
VTVCSSSGAFTRIVSRVAGPSGISARTLRRKAAMASTAASVEALGWDSNGVLDAFRIGE